MFHIKMNGFQGSAVLLLPSNVYPKRNASPKRHIQQIVITQSTTTFAQSAVNHQNPQYRQNHLNVLKSLEGTPEKKQTGFHLKNLKEQFIDSDPFKQYQRNLKRFQFNQKSIQNPPPIHPPDEELVPNKLVQYIQESDHDTRPKYPVNQKNGSDEYSDEDSFTAAEKKPVHDVETFPQEKLVYIPKKEEMIDNYRDIETENPDNRPICPKKEIYDSLNYSDEVDSVDDFGNQPVNRVVNWRDNQTVQKAMATSHSNRPVQKVQQDSTPFYQKEATPKYSRTNKDVNAGQSDSSSNPTTKSRRDLTTTKTPENTPSSETPGLEQVSNLMPCQYCNRKFAKSRLETHEEICERTLKKQRNKYDATRHRLKGTVIEEYKFRKGETCSSTGASRKPGRQDDERQISSRYGNAEPSFPGNATLGNRTNPVKRTSAVKKPSAKVDSNLNNSTRPLQGDKTERGRRGDTVVTNRKSFSKFEDAPTQNPVNRLGARKGYAGSQIEITRKASAKAANPQSHGDRSGARRRADSARRQSDLKREASEDELPLATNYGPRPKAGAGSRSNTTRHSTSLFDDPPVGDKFENRDLNKKGSKSPTRSLPALNRNKR